MNAVSLLVYIHVLVGGAGGSSPPTAMLPSIVMPTDQCQEWAKTHDANKDRPYNETSGRPILSSSYSCLPVDDNTVKMIFSAIGMSKDQLPGR